MAENGKSHETTWYDTKTMKIAVGGQHRRTRPATGLSRGKVLYKWREIVDGTGEGKDVQGSDSS